MNDPASVLAELAQVAADVGPALAPAGHDELLESITEAARRLFGAGASSLALLDEAEEELVFHVATGPAAKDVVGLRMPATQGIAGWVVTSGQALAVADVSRDPRFARDVAEGVGYLPTSILATPMETPRRMVGVLSVLDRRSQGGDAAEGADDMELLSLFATQAALAIESARVFADLGRTLFEAAASVSSSVELRHALDRLAQGAPPPSDELAHLAAAFAELGRAGPEERRVATDLVSTFLSYRRRTARPR